MNKKQTDRLNRLMPNGIPKWIRCYDNGGETADRYTIVFTGNYSGRTGCDYVGCSDNPFHPQGIYLHGEHTSVIDYPSYSHLGKKIKFIELPEAVQIAVKADYRDIWDLPNIMENPLSFR